MKRIACGLLMAALASTAGASQWKTVWDSPENGKWQFEAETIKRQQPNIVEFWAKAFPSKEQAAKWPFGDFVVYHVAGVCNGETFTTDHTVAYDKAGHSQASSEISSDVRPPDSLWFMMFDAVCHYKAKS